MRPTPSWYGNQSIHRLEETVMSFVYDDDSNFRLSESELSSRHESAKNNLSFLLEQQAKRLSSDTKEAIEEHLFQDSDYAPYIFGWVYSAEQLIQKARDEVDAYNNEDDSVSYEAVYWDRYVDLEEYLDCGNKIATNDGSHDEGRGNSRGHRRGFKPPKSELWTRPAPTRWHRHHQTLRDLRRNRKEAKRHTQPQQ